MSDAEPKKRDKSRKRDAVTVDSSDTKDAKDAKDTSSSSKNQRALPPSPIQPVRVHQLFPVLQSLWPLLPTRMS